MSVNTGRRRQMAPIDAVFVTALVGVCIAVWMVDKDLSVSLVVLAAALVIGIAMAWFALKVAVAFWLAVVGYVVAGWLGAFVGLCATLILNAVRDRAATEAPRPVSTRREEPYKPGFPL